MSNLQNNTDSLSAKIDKAKIPNGWKILFERISSQARSQRENFKQMFANSTVLMLQKWQTPKFGVVQNFQNTGGPKRPRA